MEEFLLSAIHFRYEYSIFLISGFFSAPRSINFYSFLFQFTIIKGKTFTGAYALSFLPSILPLPTLFHSLHRKRRLFSLILLHSPFTLLRTTVQIIFIEFSSCINGMNTLFVLCNVIQPQFDLFWHLKPHQAIHS